MNCPKCQRAVLSQARFCPYCQTSIPQPEASEIPANPPAAPPNPSPLPQPVQSMGNLFGILSIVCSLIGIFIFGIVFGPAAIILGILGLRQQKNDPLSIIGIVIGSIEVIWLGIYFAALLNSEL